MILTSRTKAGLAAWWRKRVGTWWWAIIVIVAPVLLIAAAAVTVLLMFVNGGDPRNQIELIKTGLTVGAGTGGVVALILAGRRQWSTEHDATQRRITELYLKAVEQLGSDKAAVRHGGLYALERVAQDNPDQRQTVVNVLCAYLRAPFHSAGAPRPVRGQGIRRPLAPSSASGTRQRAAPVTGDRIEFSSNTQLDDDARQELQVRLTAEHIIAAHLRPGDDEKHPVDTFWQDIDVDLTGATLIGFDFARTQVRTALFDGAHFVGQRATFFRATFVGRATFFASKFAGNAWFGSADFALTAEFREARFCGDTDFADTVFNAGLELDGVQFASGVPHPLKPHIQTSGKRTNSTAVDQPQPPTP